MTSYNHMIEMAAKGGLLRQTNWMPGGGKTFNWTDSTYHRAVGKRKQKGGH